MEIQKIVKDLESLGITTVFNGVTVPNLILVATTSELDYWGDEIKEWLNSAHQISVINLNKIYTFCSPVTNYELRGVHCQIDYKDEFENEWKDYRDNCDIMPSRDVSNMYIKTSTSFFVLETIEWDEEMFEAWQVDQIENGVSNLMEIIEENERCNPTYAFV